MTGISETIEIRAAKTDNNPDSHSNSRGSPATDSGNSSALNSNNVRNRTINSSRNSNSNPGRPSREKARKRAIATGAGAITGREIRRARKAAAGAAKRSS